MADMLILIGFLTLIRGIHLGIQLASIFLYDLYDELDTNWKIQTSWYIIEACRLFFSPF